MKKKILVYCILISLVIIRFIKIPLKYKNDNVTKKYILMIDSIRYKKENCVSYLVKLGNKKSNNYIFKDKFVLNIYTRSYDKNILQNEDVYNFEYGEIICVSGKFNIYEYMNNPGEFNYKIYLYSNNIYGTINTYESVKKLDKTSHKLNILDKGLSILYKYKEYMSSKLDKKLSSKYSNIIKGIIYGEKQDIDEKIKDDLKKLGVSHILSVSGVHISSLIITLNILFYKIKKKKVKKIIQMIFVIVYVVISKMSISAIRAGIMIIFTIAYDIKSVKKDRIKVIINTALIILLISPYAIFNIGFKLSFLSTLGITLFGKYFRSITFKKLKSVKNNKLKFILQYILNSIFITLSVQLMILPIEISNLNNISLLIFISNFIFGIFTVPIQIVGSIYMLFCYIPYLDNLLILILYINIKIIIFISNFLSLISFNFSTMSYPFIFHIFYYFVLFLIYITLKLKRIFNVKKINKLCLIFAVIYVFSILTYTIYFINYSSFIYFFNVGQGEMSYIKNKKNSVIIDIGSINYTLAGNTINNYFKSKNIKYVDVVILTHMHSDHINGLEKLLDICKVGKVVCPYVANDEIYLNILNMCKNYNVKIENAIKGDVYKIGDIEIKVLSPPKSKINDKDSINANSLICKVSCNKKSILYMADATYNTEKTLLNNEEELNDIHILKVSHHGSKNASCEEFINKIKPQYAVISAKKKYYNHPSEETISVLKKYKSHILITENVGAIKFNMYNFL